MSIFFVGDCRCANRLQEQGAGSLPTVAALAKVFRYRISRTPAGGNRRVRMEAPVETNLV